MKLTTILTACSSVIATAFLASSCVKETGKEVAMEMTDYSSKSFIQVYNGTVGAARNQYHVDGARVTGGPQAYGGTFPATPSLFAVTSGFRAFLVYDTLVTTTQPPMSFAENLQMGANYTIFMYDTLNSPKQKIVQNNIIIPSDTTSRIRFANFIFSKTAVPNVDLFSVKRNANVFTNVNITEVTNYIPHPSSRNTAQNDTLYVRETGTMVTLATLTGFAPVQKRSYTLVFRGRYQSTTGTPIRTLSSFSSN